jgi:transposase InsO family protein
MVIVDRLTKQRHLIPCHTTTNAKAVAEIYLGEVWRHHGLPSHITSDRGTQFTAKFWKHLTGTLGIEPRMSTAYHPQTDDQTERLNAVMEQYL